MSLHGGIVVSTPTSQQESPGSDSSWHLFCVGFACFPQSKNTLHDSKLPQDVSMRDSVALQQTGNMLRVYFTPT